MFYLNNLKNPKDIFEKSVQIQIEKLIFERFEKIKISYSKQKIYQNLLCLMEEYFNEVILEVEMVLKSFKYKPRKSSWSNNEIIQSFTNYKWTCYCCFFIEQER